jgi:hypothetical protein
MHKWEDNIEMDLREVGWEMEMIDLARNMEGLRTLVKAVMNLWVP